MSAKSRKAVARKAPAKPKPLTLAEKLNNHMPPGILVEAAEDGKTRILVDSTVCDDRFRSVGGCRNEFANLMVLHQVLATLPQASDLTTAAVRATGAVHMVEAFAPKDGVEAMIASQAVALHMLTMETVRRAQVSGQPIEATSRLRRDAANTARAMVEMTEALERRRGKGPQRIVVERVVVNEGGQAIVGHVSPQQSLAPVSVAPALVGASEGEGGGHVISNEEPHGAKVA